LCCPEEVQDGGFYESGDEAGVSGYKNMLINEQERRVITRSSQPQVVRLRKRQNREGVDMNANKPRLNIPTCGAGSSEQQDQ